MGRKNLQLVIASRICLRRHGLALVTAIIGMGFATLSSAQTELSAQAVESTRVIILGSAGGPVLNAQRAATSSAVVVNDTIYMIDSGEGSVRRLKEAGFDAHQVTQLFLTHLHLDHTLDLPSLVASSWQFDDRQDLSVTGPPGTNALIQSMLGFLNIGEKIYSPQMPPHPAIEDTVHVHELGKTTQPSEIYRDDNVRVFAVENTHYALLPETGLPFEQRSYSYRFETKDRTIVFSGDTGPSAALAKLAAGADILISEVVDLHAISDYVRERSQTEEKHLEALIDHMAEEHLVPEEIGKLASKAGVGMVVLNHIVPSFHKHTSILSARVRSHFNGPVIVATDLLEF